jgi:hypothetical protein
LPQGIFSKSNWLFIRELSYFLLELLARNTRIALAKKNKNKIKGCSGIHRAVGNKING